MTLHTITLARPQVLPQNTDCDCCAAHVVEALRYDHPVCAVEGMDCADCARTLERGVARIQGVHYAIINFTAAKLRLEYDREQTSSEAIAALASRLGYTLRLPTPDRQDRYS